MAHGLGLVDLATVAANANGSGPTCSLPGGVLGAPAKSPEDGEYSQALVLSGGLGTPDKVAEGDKYSWTLALGRGLALLKGPLKATYTRLWCWITLWC